MPSKHPFTCEQNYYRYELSYLPLVLKLSDLKDIVQSLYNTMFGSIGTDCVINESCYKVTIIQRNYRKMTIVWSFSYNSIVCLI